jgi:PAS domain-containing protein
MQTVPPPDGDDFVAWFALQRQNLLRRASSLLTQEPLPPAGDAHDGLPHILLTALELLKAADEGLLNDRRERAHERSRIEREPAHARSLFRRAPAALFLTTSDTTIRELNDAAIGVTHLSKSFHANALSTPYVRNRSVAFATFPTYA